MNRKMYTTETAAVSGPYSHAVEGGPFVFLSGQTAMNGIDAKEKGDITEQTMACFQHLFSVLDQAGLTADDVVKVNVYLTDMAHFEAMNAVYREQFVPPYPARTAVAVTALPLGADVEIEMTALRPQR